MGGAVTLVARNKSAKAIEPIWEEAARLEDEPFMKSLNYPPHITLVMCDDLDGAALQKMLGRSFNIETPIRVQFSKIKLVDRNQLGLWLMPGKIDRLQALFHAVQSHIDSADCRPAFQPGKWAPHCTLAAKIPPTNKAAATDFAATKIEPIEMVFNAIEIVDYAPIEVVQQWRLDI